MNNHSVEFKVGDKVKVNVLPYATGFGEIIFIDSDGRATVKMDGYACTSSFLPEKMEIRD